MPSFLFGRNRNRGLTIIEVVVVLVLIGILTVTVLIKVNGAVDASQVDSDLESLKNHLRYVQIWSMGNTGRVYGIKCTGAKYTAFYLDFSSDASTIDISGATDITLPGNETEDNTLEYTTTSAFNVAFDFTGRPFVGTGDDLKLRTSDYSITLSGTEGSNTITITAYTGFIP